MLSACRRCDMSGWAQGPTDESQIAISTPFHERVILCKYDAKPAQAILAHSGSKRAALGHYYNAPYSIPKIEPGACRVRAG